MGLVRGGLKGWLGWGGRCCGGHLMGVVWGSTSLAVKCSIEVGGGRRLGGARV